MKLIVGLGNPGKQYESNRHNVGYMVIDQFQKHKMPNGVVAKKTGVFMNNSGEAVKNLIENLKYKIENLVIVHDDLDIPLGKFKIQFAKGPKDHKGIQSVDKALGTGDYWRVRIGVDSRDPENRVSGEEYTLQDFLPEERRVLDGVIEKIVKMVKQSLAIRYAHG